MSAWTHEDEEKLVEMLKRRDAACFAQRKVALEIIQLLSDDEGNPNAAWGPVQAKQIRELLAPYDEAHVEFVPMHTPGEVIEIPYPYDKPKMPGATACYRRPNSPLHEWLLAEGIIHVGAGGKKSVKWQCTRCGSRTETFS